MHGVRRRADRGLVPVLTRSRLGRAVAAAVDQPALPDHGQAPRLAQHPPALAAALLGDRAARRRRRPVYCHRSPRPWQRRRHHAEGVRGMGRACRPEGGRDDGRDPAPTRNRLLRSREGRTSRSPRTCARRSPPASSGPETNCRRWCRWRPPTRSRQGQRTGRSPGSRRRASSMSLGAGGHGSSGAEQQHGVGRPTTTVMSA